MNYLQKRREIFLRKFGGVFTEFKMFTSPLTCLCRDLACPSMRRDSTKRARRLQKITSRTTLLWKPVPQQINQPRLRFLKNRDYIQSLQASKGIFLWISV